MLEPSFQFTLHLIVNCNFFPEWEEETQRYIFVFVIFVFVILKKHYHQTNCSRFYFNLQLQRTKVHNDGDSTAVTNSHEDRSQKLKAKILNHKLETER